MIYIRFLFASESIPLRLAVVKHLHPESWPKVQLQDSQYLAANSLRRKIRCQQKIGPDRESGPNISSAISRIEFLTLPGFSYFEGGPLAPFAAGGQGVSAGG